MADKYYAVQKGRHPGVYETWDACSAEVKGFSGAVYKSFRSFAEAKAFAAGEEQEMFQDKDDVLAEAYVDGSFNAATGMYGWGAVIYFGGEVYEFSGASGEPALAPMRNVAGEIMGARMAIDFCLRQGIDAVSIYHDYEGIGKWADGKWKANNPLTQGYSRYVANARTRMSIEFVKVKAHAGNKYNEMADKLAKEALGI